jgi:hypothetical protein
LRSGVVRLPPVNCPEQFSFLGPRFEFCDEAGRVHKARKHAVDRNRHALASGPHQLARRLAGGLSGSKTCEIEGAAADTESQKAVEHQEKIASAMTVIDDLIAKRQEEIEQLREVRATLAGAWLRSASDPS